MSIQGPNLTEEEENTTGGVDVLGTGTGTGTPNPGTEEQGDKPTSTASPRAKKGLPATSGMFQNIKKYAAANKPQAAKMAGAVTKNVGDQASKIKEAMQRQEGKFNTSLNQRQGMIDQGKDFTSGVIGGIDTINNPQAVPEAPVNQDEAVPTPPPQIGPSQEDFDRFRQYQTGGAQQFKDAAGLNILQQEQDARELKRLTGASTTGQGRRELLKNTFAKQSPYTSGMQGLDDLIVSSDEDARTRLVNESADITNEQQSNLDEARRTAVSSLAGYNRNRDEFNTELDSDLTSASTGFTDKADATAADEKEKRTELANLLGADETNLDEYLDERFTSKFGKEALAEAVSKIGGQIRVNTNSHKQIPEMKEQWRSGSRNADGSYSSGYNTMVPTGRTIDNPNYDPEAPKYSIGSGGGYKPGQDSAAWYTSGQAASQRFGSPSNVVNRLVNDDELDILGLTNKDLNFNIAKHGYLNSGYNKSLGSDTKHWSAYSTGRMKNEINRLRGTVQDTTGRDAIVKQLMEKGGGRAALEKLGKDGQDMSDYDYYDSLAQGDDISSQSSASADTIARYNALRDLQSGKDTGDRALLSGQEVQTTQANQDLLAKMQKMVADKMKNLQGS